MKRIFILLSILLLVQAVPAMAQTATTTSTVEKEWSDYGQMLIDFSTLTVKDLGDGLVENEDTLLDFSIVAGSDISDVEKRKLKTSLAIDNWGVELASSSQLRENVSLSFTKTATTTANAPRFFGMDMSNKLVMGVRIHFPTSTFNSYAIIKPPFEIPAYSRKTTLDSKTGVLTDSSADKKGSKYDGKGVVKNIGPIKKVSILVNGRNFPHGLGLLMRDQDGEDQEIFFGYVNFTGWRRLEWVNPNYIEEVRNRELRTSPLYPKSEPFRKLIGIIVYRDATAIGGDFVMYLKEIQIIADKAVLKPTAVDIEDEEVWGILQKREEERRDAEVKRLGDIQLLRYLEKKKLYTSK